MTWTTVAIAVFILLIAAPYVASIRHPQQRPFAAYLIFMTVFSVTAVVLFLLIGWLAHSTELASALGELGLALALLIFGLLPAIIVASWQARKPPTQRPPPD